MDAHKRHITSKVIRNGLVIILAAGMAFTVAGPDAFGAECPHYSQDLDRALWKAHSIGDPVNRGHTLAAMVAHEAGGVHPLVIRVNPEDGRYGSYGLMHMKLTTAMLLLGETNIWQAKADIAPRLMTDDVFALQLGLTYLQRHESHGWHGQISRYNGSGTGTSVYSNTITGIANRLESCGYFTRR